MNYNSWDNYTSNCNFVQEQKCKTAVLNGDFFPANMENPAKSGGAKTRILKVFSDKCRKKRDFIALKWIFMHNETEKCRKVSEK